MSSTEIIVVPHNETTTVTVTRFEISQVTVTLFKSAQVIVNLYAAERKYLKCEVIDLTQEEYLGWNNNDEYLVDLVCSKLGLTKA
jgi:hypothetical protein